MPASLRPGDDIQYLKGVGPHLSQRLRKLGIETIHDLFLFLPRDYEDRRNLRRLAHARDGEKATFFVESVDVSSFYYRGKRHPKIKVTDGSGTAAAAGVAAAAICPAATVAFAAGMAAKAAAANTAAARMLVFLLIFVSFSCCWPPKPKCPGDC